MICFRENTCKRWDSAWFELVCWVQGGPLHQALLYNKEVGVRKITRNYERTRPFPIMKYHVIETEAGRGRDLQ